jgi:hypothetical protein
MLDSPFVAREFVESHMARHHQTNGRFDFNDFSIASCNMLIAEFPDHPELITRLTRSNADNR